MAQTVHGNVHLTVYLIHVDTRTDHVLVLQVGWVIIVLQVIFAHDFLFFFNKFASLDFKV